MQKKTEFCRLFQVDFKNGSGRNHVLAGFRAELHDTFRVIFFPFMPESVYTLMHTCKCFDGIELIFKIHFFKLKVLFPNFYINYWQYKRNLFIKGLSISILYC